MTNLLSPPEEIITQIYIFAGENTRALVRLSAVNRRLRALWLQDSDYIIAQSLELKAPGHQDAIALTLMEACCPMPVSGFHRVNASKDDPSLRQHLPGLLRNLDIASTVRTYANVEVEAFDLLYAPLFHLLPFSCCLIRYLSAYLPFSWTTEFITYGTANTTRGMF